MSKLNSIQAARKATLWVVKLVLAAGVLCVCVAFLIPIAEHHRMALLTVCAIIVVLWFLAYTWWIVYLNELRN